MARMLGEEPPANYQRIDPCRVGELIQEALIRVGRVSGAYRSPPQCRDAHLRDMCRDAEVRHLVGQRACPFDHSLVDTVFQHGALERRAPYERLADNDLVPGDDIAICIEPALQVVHEYGAVAAAAKRTCAASAAISPAGVAR